MDAAAGIPCVIYGAKSTEDRRGSIPEQLRECREAIDADPLRRFVADYNDEKFSAYRGSRGPDLVDAMEHAEELAAEHGLAELWAQHSDRLARGDGRSARHTVEIALWALKNDVRVRTLQDPDTFRDLLYAVVTGQRNNEDARRKGVASAAGRKRAVERGDYTGSKPDGYRRVVDVDQTGAVKRRLDIDPARSPVIEMIFGMTLRRKGTGEIARAVSDAGWLTKPLSRRDQPKPWTIHSVREVLKNPRYAGRHVCQALRLPQPPLAPPHRPLPAVPDRRRCRRGDVRIHDRVAAHRWVGGGGCVRTHVRAGARELDGLPGAPERP